MKFVPALFLLIAAFVSGSIQRHSDNDLSRPVTVSDVEHVVCHVKNGPIRSGVFTRYLGWSVGGKTYDLSSGLSISAESRLTRVRLEVSGSNIELCTGLAKHENSRFLKSPSGRGSQWSYIGLYGKQSINEDNLGIAVFYRNADEVRLTSDSLSEIVVLRPNHGRLEYYFGATWEKEPGGIKNRSEFSRYLEATTETLNTPIRVSL